MQASLPHGTDLDKPASGTGKNVHKRAESESLLFTPRRRRHLVFINSQHQLQSDADMDLEPIDGDEEPVRAFSDRTVSLQAGAYKPAEVNYHALV